MDVEAERRNPNGAKKGDANPPFTFTRAVELMSANSPALREAKSEYQTALVLTKIKTPLPNPAFEAGPRYGFGPDVGNVRPFIPFGSLGFTIPTGKRLKRQDELNQVLAEVAYVEAQAKHRELYLELRKLYSRLMLARARFLTRESLAASAEKSVSVSKRLVEAGQATSLDTGLLELEYGRTRTELMNAGNEIASIEGEMSELIGVNAEHFQGVPTMALPDGTERGISRPELLKTLVCNHPQLARLRARYEAAERELHLEIAKQYPDFHFGPSLEGDAGARKHTVGLTLGIDIPVFDRNQQAIATALQRREEIKTKYETAANKALSALDKAIRKFTLAVERSKFLKTELRPKAHTNVELARKSLEAGGGDTLKFLETERAERTVTIDLIESVLSTREAWIEIEQAVGYPLILFPDEQRKDFPALPDIAGVETDAEPAPKVIDVETGDPK